MEEGSGFLRTWFFKRWGAIVLGVFWMGFSSIIDLTSCPLSLCGGGFVL